MDSPAELDRRTLAEGRHLRLETITWRAANGATHEWETADRVGGIRAVLVIARLVPSQRLVLVRQYRPPARAAVLEFPAGLIDPGETPQQTALRELREETGYVGTIEHISPPTFTSPGLSSESACQVRVIVNETESRNSAPSPAPDGCEAITVVTVPLTTAGPWLQAAFDRGEQVDAKVAAYLLGLETARRGWT